MDNERKLTTNSQYLFFSLDYYNYKPHGMHQTYRSIYPLDLFLKALAVLSVTTGTDQQGHVQYTCFTQKDIKYIMEKEPCSKIIQYLH